MQHSYGRRDDLLAAEPDIARGHGAVAVGGWDPFDVPEGGAPLEPKTGWVEPKAPPDDAFVRPAGLVWSTAADQARLLGFLLDGNPKVLSNELRAQMRTAHSPWYNHVDLRGYGYGMIIDRYYQAPEPRVYAVPSYTHGGATLSMTSSSSALPEQRVAVCILSNGAGEDREGLTATVLEVAAEGRLPEPSEPEAPPEPTDLHSYAGTYTEPSVGDVTLTWQDDALHVEIPSLDQLGIAYEPEPVALARDLFVFSIDGASRRLSSRTAKARPRSIPRAGTLAQGTTRVSTNSRWTP